MQHLQPNTTLQGGKYRIERVLGQGGFGNTYVGVNTVFNERVAIKEFFMRGVTLREDDHVTVSVSVPDNRESFKEQKEKFKKEALRIRLLKNEHIIGVQDFFEENGTAYYVMDFVDGENLAERLKKTGRPMTESEVRLILPQILDALKAVHAEKMWHLDLKPANIMLEKGGKVKLIDFGASKQLNAQKGGATTSTAISYTNGYAPREQMEQNYDKFGPWTDIYALGATLYNLLTNKRPPLPTDIDDDMSEDKHNALPFPESVGEMKYLVLQMMKTNRLQRPQSIDAIISAEKTIKEEPKQTPKSEKTPKSSSVYDDEATVIETSNKESQFYNVSKTTTTSSTNNSYIPQIDEEISTNKTVGIILFLCFIIGIIIYFGTRETDGYGTKEVDYGWGSGTYEGYLKKGKPDGHGVIKYYDGSKFEGEFIDGETNGHGKYISSDGVTRYDGMYANGRRTQGLMTNKDGSQYNGNFKNGLPDGKGKLMSANGDLMFEGDFSLGRRWNGKGKEYGNNPNGQSWEYEGDYKNGIWNGKGTIKWSNGDKYEGDWKEGNRTGNGIYTYNEKRNGYGYKYVGGFLKGEFHGKGTWYYVGGGSEKCTYKNGKQIQ